MLAGTAAAPVASTAQLSAPAHAYMKVRIHACIYIYRHASKYASMYASMYVCRHACRHAGRGACREAFANVNVGVIACMRWHIINTLGDPAVHMLRVYAHIRVFIYMLT